MKVSVNNTVLSCEHASNRIPAAYQYLFTRHQQLLVSHRGWDPGAFECASRLAKKLHLPLIKGTCSRLLIDLNRSLHHRQVFSELSRPLSRQERQGIIDTVYQPYRERLRQAIVRFIDEYGFALHISLHSFTPDMYGAMRNADIGLLYDPRRKFEKLFAGCLQSHLQAMEPGLRIRRNYPYRGIADGATKQYRKEFAGGEYAGVEIEINQKYPMAGDRRSWQRLQDRIIQALSTVYHSSDLSIEQQT